jgi:hypothetical protein
MNYHYWFNLKFEKRATLDNLVDSPTRLVGEAFFDFKYLHEFEAKIQVAIKGVLWTYEERIYAKPPENPL